MRIDLSVGGVGVAAQPRDDAARDLHPVADVMRILADATRLKLLMVLAAQGETHVTDLCQWVNAPQPMVSHHLGLLRMGGLVTTRRQGKMIHYRLAHETHAQDLLRVPAGTGSVLVQRK
jgi:ArsR family transcriptional regulator